MGHEILAPLFGHMPPRCLKLFMSLGSSYDNMRALQLTPTIVLLRQDTPMSSEHPIC